MSANLITKYLTYKKKRLASYGLALYSDLDYRSYILECLQKYINNYIVNVNTKMYKKGNLFMYKKRNEIVHLI